MAIFYRSTARAVRVADLDRGVSKAEYVALHDALAGRLATVVSSMSCGMVDLEAEWRPIDPSPSGTSEAEGRIRSVFEQEAKARGLTLVWNGTTRHGG